jgi:amino acid adenylation domain-containing protein
LSTADRTMQVADDYPNTRARANRVAAEWDNGATTSPTAVSLPALVAAHASSTPDAVAVVAPGATLNYAQLDARANCLAASLHAQGTGRGAVVGLLTGRSTGLVVGALGILKAGATYLPLDPGYPADRLAYMVEDARASAIVCDAALAGRAAELGANTIIEIESLDPPFAVPAWHGVDPSPTDVAYIIYTSGSSGHPKGVLVGHDNLLNLIWWHREAFALTSADRTSQLAGLGFDATVWEIWPTLTAGASLYICDDQTRLVAEDLQAWLAANRITVSFVPTVLAERLLALPWPAESQLRFLLTGAEALRNYPRADLPFTLVNNYGPTECTVVATSGRVVASTAPTSRLPSIGRAIANVRVYIVDSSGNEAPVGSPGELYIGGAGVARGYVNQAELTTASFVANKFDSRDRGRLYRTGDQVRYIASGELEFLGRVDGQVKIRGNRVEPDEIAAVLNEHPAVQTSVVMARPGANEELRLVAYVIANPGCEISSNDARAYLGSSLPDYMLPSVVVTLNDLPLTPNGKVDRAALPDPESLAYRFVDTEFLSPVEARLATIVQALLGRQSVRANDNFFDLGGHSLFGGQLIAHIRDAFGVELKLRTVFESPTVSGLAAAVEELMIARIDGLSDEEVERLLG